MIIQNSYAQRIDEAVPGLLFGTDRNRRWTGRAARGLLKVGYAAFRVPGVGSVGVASRLDPGQCFQIPNPIAGADVDAIITSITSSASVQSFTGTALNGVVGAAEMQPARFVTLVLSNHADWDATTATLTGVDHLGQIVSESLSIPNGGNSTVTSSNRFVRVTSLSIPAQSGTGGTATVGVSALPALTLTDFLGVVARKVAKTSLTAGGLYGYPGQTSTLVEATYVDGEMVDIMTEGGIWVKTEEAVDERDPVYVRIASGAGGSQIGAFRNDADTASAVLVTGAKFMRYSSAAGVAQLYLPAGY